LLVVHCNGRGVIAAVRSRAQRAIRVMEDGVNFRGGMSSGQGAPVNSSSFCEGMTTHKEGGTMKKFFGKKRTLALAVVAVLAVAGAAIAYFSTTGSGTGTATVGTNSALTLHATVSGDHLYPGDTTGDSVSFTADNPSSGVQHVNTIKLDSISVDSNHSTCAHVLGTDFSMADVSANQDIPSGNGQAVTATGTLKMLDSGVNQDACKGAILTLNLSSN
jgi:hypothetical protein